MEVVLMFYWSILTINSKGANQEKAVAVPKKKDLNQSLKFRLIKTFEHKILKKNRKENKKKYLLLKLTL